MPTVKQIVAMIKKTLVLSLFFLTAFNLSVFAGGEPASKGGIYNPVPTIMHHIADAHEWHLWGEGDNSFSIPLLVDVNIGDNWGLLH